MSILALALFVVSFTLAFTLIEIGHRRRMRAIDLTGNQRGALLTLCQISARAGAPYLGALVVDTPFREQSQT